MKLLVLGGTGFLGTSLKKKYPEHIYWGTKNYIVEQTNPSIVLEYVYSNNITHIIDFTKNKHSHIIPAMKLINGLSENTIYVHISTYGVMFDNMFFNEEEYYSTKRIIEQSIRPMDYSIRVPMILETQDKELIFKGVRTEYMYSLLPEEFVYHLMYILENSSSGLHIMQSRVIYK